MCVSSPSPLISGNSRELEEGVYFVREGSLGVSKIDGSTVFMVMITLLFYCNLDAKMGRRKERVLTVVDKG